MGLTLVLISASDARAQKTPAAIQAEITASSASGLLGGTILNDITNSFLSLTNGGNVKSNIAIDPTGVFTNRNAELTLFRNLTVAPAGVLATSYFENYCKGDNTTFIGCSAMFATTGDTAGVNAGNKGVLYGIQIQVLPTISRNNSPVDDVDGLVVQSGAAAGITATDAIYVGDSGTGTQQWVVAYLSNTRATYAFRALNTISTGLDMASATITGNAIQSPGLTVSNVGAIASTINQNAESNVTISNNSNGTGADALFLASNGTVSAKFGIAGTNLTAFGILTANSTFVYEQNNPLVLIADGSGIIQFASGGHTETARFTGLGGLNVGATADPGAGVINANNGFSSGASVGTTVTTTVRNAAGSGTCTIIFKGGINIGTGTC